MYVFCYDFPHRKTQDVLLRCRIEGIPVDGVLAAPRVELELPPSTIRTRVRPAGLVHPRRVADALGVPYHVTPHADALDVLPDAPGLGLVAGARVLPGPVVRAFDGIINLHPGPLPEARGLDALPWCIHEGLEPFVTAHLIDERVDAGRLLLRRRLRVRRDDTLLDIGERVHGLQLDMIRPALDAAQAGDAAEVGPGPYRGKMDPATEQETLRRLPAWLEAWA